MQEIWKDIPDLNGRCQVSNLARIRSVPCVITTSNGRKFTVKGKVKTLTIGNNGYYFFNAGKNKPYYVHRAVAKCFVKNKDPKSYLVVDHLDENKLNNMPDNLEWTSNRENAKRWMSKRDFSGSKNNGHILKESDVRHIRSEIDKMLELYDHNNLCKIIAGGYRVSSSTIRDILTNRTWNHVR